MPIMSEKHFENYGVEGEQVMVTSKVLKRGLDVTTEKVTTAEEYDRAIEAIIEAAKGWSDSSKAELRERIIRNENPHAQELLRIKEPFRLGFDVTREGLGFFVEHEDLPPEQMLAVLEAPGNSMSRSDRQRAKKIRSSR